MVGLSVDQYLCRLAFESHIALLERTRLAVENTESFRFVFVHYLIDFMSKLVVDVGNCGPDFNSIRQMVKSHFDASVVQTHGAQDTLELLHEKEVDLITVNRKLDRDYSDGLDLIKEIKADRQFDSIPIMLVTNYDEHQQSAMEIGCVRGFGKLSINDAETIERLQPYLGKVKTQTH